MVTFAFVIRTERGAPKLGERTAPRTARIEVPMSKRPVATCPRLIWLAPLSNPFAAKGMAISGA